MFHKVDTVFNSKTSKVLPGARVQVYSTSGVIQPLYADVSGTPISTVSGEANTAVTNDDGLYDFWVADGTYDIRFFVGVTPYLVLAKIAMDNSASGVGFAHTAPATVGTVARRLKQQVFITDAPFNATCDGSADDTAAFQAALTYVENAGGGDVVCPGNTKVTSTLNVTKPNVTVRGFGDKSLLLPTGNYGDVFHVKPVVGPNLQGFRMEGMYIYAQSDTTSGAILHLEDCNGFRVTGCRLSSHFGGILLDGSINGDVDANITSDANFAAFRAGSNLVRVKRSAAGRIPAELRFGKSNLRGQNGNFRLNYGVLIECVDGIWFDDPHIGFSRVGMALNPTVNTDPIISVNVARGYLDTCETNWFQTLRPSASYSADYGLHNLDFAQMYNAGTDGLLFFCESTGKNLWSTMSLGNMLQAGEHGVNVGLANSWNFSEGWSMTAPGNTVAGKNGVTINNATSRINLGGGVVERGASPNTPNAAVQITSLVDKFTVGRIRAINCTSAIADTSVTAQKSIATPLLW